MRFCRRYSQGHTYLPEQELYDRAAALLNVEGIDIEKHVMDLVMDRKLMVKERDGQKIIYAAQYYYMELNTAKMLLDLNIKDSIPQAEMEQKIRKIEERENIALDDMQRRAVMEAVNNGLTIITGGPGTGKTTTINTIIEYFDAEGLDILLAAPTGRAAKRMTEATGYQAQTIHRMLELSGAPDEDGPAAGFGRNEENPLEADVVIIDEMSMVDIQLMHSLFEGSHRGDAPDPGGGCESASQRGAGKCAEGYHPFPLL